MHLASNGAPHTKTSPRAQALRSNAVRSGTASCIKSTICHFLIDRRWCSANWHSAMSGSSPGTDCPAFWRSAPQLPASRCTAVSEPASLQLTLFAQWSSWLARNARNIRTGEKENLGRPADRRSSGLIASRQLLCSLRTRPETSSSA